MRSRTPPGVRELKHPARETFTRLGRRTPPGVRELKHQIQVKQNNVLLSHPSRGA